MMVSETPELSIDQLVRRSEEGAFALPFFQRDYVWEAKEIRVFLDSVFRGWPTGSIILWTRPSVRGRKFGSLRGNPKEITVNALVLDGQQRITTLLLLRRDGRLNLEGGYGKTTTHYFFFDLEENKFVDSREDNLDEGRYIDVEDILRGKINIKKIKRNYQSHRKTSIKKLKDIPLYKFQFVYTDVKKEEDAIEIFNRVNTAGKKVDKVELAFARLKDREHSVTRKIVKFQKTYASEGFDFGSRILINSFLIVQNINNKDAYISTRNADTQIRNYLNDNPNVNADWKKVFKRVKSVLDFLKLVGFDSDQFLTAENTIAALAGYFERNDISAYELSTRKKNDLKRWLFRTLIYGRYTRSTNFLKDLDDLSDYGRFKLPSRGTYSENGVIGVMYAIGRKQRMTDYRENEITWADTTRAGRVIHVDHIYPFSRLMNGPISDVLDEEAEVLTESVGNKAFAIGETNASKSKKFPGEKIGHNVIGQWFDGNSLLGDSDYRKMLKTESVLKRNCREIKRFINDRKMRIERDIKREIN